MLTTQHTLNNVRRADLLVMNYVSTLDFNPNVITYLDECFPSLEDFTTEERFEYLLSIAPACSVK